MVAGCASEPAIVACKIKDELRKCEEEPFRPEGNYGTIAAGQYIVDLQYSIRDCREAIRAVSALP